MRVQNPVMAGRGGVVGRAQPGVSATLLRVADRAPGPAQALGRDVEHARHRLPLGRIVGRHDGLQRLLSGLLQLGDRGLDMLGADRVEQRRSLKSSSIGGSAAEGGGFLGAAVAFMRLQMGRGMRKCKR